MSSNSFRVSAQKKLFKNIAAVLFIGLAPWGMAQQADNAIVVGTVYDTSHSIVSGAAVKLTHLATNAVTEVHTD